MKKAPEHEFSPARQKAEKKAIKLEWITLAYTLSVASLMYIVMGSSQAMKTAWAEDLLSLVPPVSFLICSHFRNKKPTARFPYGFHRVCSVGFLVAALALLIVGGWLVVESVQKLVQQTHPSIGMKEFFGHDMWLGWWMMPVLIYGTFPPILLGHAKIKLARQLNDKTLYTDAKMNKADWMTAVAAMAGVVGIGYGLWWADAAAALFIAADILKDGWTQTKDAVTGLINRAPTDLEGQYSDLPEKIIRNLEKYDWVNKADVRLHEQGHLIFGEGFVINDKKTVSADQIQMAVKKIEKLDWRIRGFVLTVVHDEKLLQQ